MDSRRIRTLVKRSTSLLDALTKDKDCPLDRVPFFVRVRREVKELILTRRELAVAVRRQRWAGPRCQALTRELFTTCSEVRQRIKNRYRGPKHAAVRSDFGIGWPVSLPKPESVVRLARQILTVAPQREAELREVRVRQATIRRIASLCGAIKDSNEDRVQWRTKERLLVRERDAHLSALEGALPQLKLLAKARRRAESARGPRQDAGQNQQGGQG